jgi:hypothetical protein
MPAGARTHSVMFKTVKRSEISICKEQGLCQRRGSALRSFPNPVPLSSSESRRNERVDPVQRDRARVPSGGDPADAQQRVTGFRLESSPCGHALSRWSCIQRVGYPRNGPGTGDAELTGFFKQVWSPRRNGRRRAVEGIGLRPGAIYPVEWLRPEVAESAPFLPEV